MVFEAIKSHRMLPGAVVMPTGCRYKAVTLYIAIMMSMLKDALLQQISVAYKCSLIYSDSISRVPGSIKSCRRALTWHLTVTIATAS